MKKLFPVLILICIVGYVTLHKPTEKSKELLSKKYPAPVEKVIVNEAYEAKPKKADRQAWFDLMHKTKDGEVWQDIEFENNKKSAKLKLKLRKALGDRSPLSSELVANDNIQGRWLERGSNNNAGSMLMVNYFQEEDLLVGVSAGGTLWKGDRTGFNWEVVNQDYRFSSALAEMRYLPDGTLRYIAAIRNEPVYSDDGGQTWTESIGVSALNGADMKDFVEDDDGRMFFLQKSASNAMVSMFMSNDNGSSFQRIKYLGSTNMDDFSLSRAGKSDDIYLIEQLNVNKSQIQKWNSETEELEIVRTSSPIGWGTGNDKVNLNVVFDGDTLRMFTMIPSSLGNKEFHTSVDTGLTWTRLSALPTAPWDVGVYVSPSNYKKVFYGEVNSYKSPNGGKSWNKISNWWEYYDNIFNKLHADIMDIKEFVDQDGEPFLVVCNHGGVSQSYDYGETFNNIGLFSLNISQYYSVATHPKDRAWVFAGAQDQGFQRGRIYGDEQASLNQIISGDYGHIVFSGKENNMWTVYPWGTISYYGDPKNLGPSASYTIDSQDESVWIPPLLGHPDTTQNAIFAAGGSIDGGPGSFMIKLDHNDQTGINATQFDYNFLLNGGGAISAMGVSSIDYNRIYVATTTGTFFTSTDGGGSFSKTQNGLPREHYLYGSCIKPSKNNVDVVYMSGNGYSTKPVWKSIDGGNSFTQMSNGMPRTMVFSIAPNEDESLIYAATEAGPYVYIAADDMWYELSGATTPNQTYWSVEYIPETQTARFGTYGRGIWDFEFESMNMVSVDDQENSAIDIQIYPNPFMNSIQIEIPTEKQWSISIVDKMGRNVHQEMIKGQKKYAYDGTELTSGIYFVTLKNDKNIITKQIIKQ